MKIFETSKVWTFVGLQRGPIHKRARRDPREPGHSWWVGSRFNKQGNLRTSLDSHSCKVRCSPTTIIKVSTDALMGSVTSTLQSSQQPVLSRLQPYKWLQPRGKGTKTYIPKGWGWVSILQIQLLVNLQSQPPMTSFLIINVSAQRLLEGVSELVSTTLGSMNI